MPCGHSLSSQVTAFWRRGFATASDAGPLVSRRSADELVKSGMKIIIIIIMFFYPR